MDIHIIQNTESAVIGESNKPIAGPLVCIYNWPPKVELEGFRTSWSRFRISFLKCRLVRLKASLISTLVNNESTLKLLCPMIVDLHILGLEVNLLDTEI